MRCEVDVEMPEPARYAEVAGRWLDGALSELAGGYRRALEEGPPLPAEAIRRPIPCGPPGAVWGFGSVVRRGPKGERRSSRVFSAKNLRWFLAQLADPPMEATLGISVLNENGYPGESPLRIVAQRDEGAPQWLRLAFEAEEEDLLDPANQAAWLRFVRAAVEQLNPSFGQISYRYGLGHTALEQTVGPPWLDTSETIPRSRQVLRGYGWLTICAQELAERLGGAEALRATGAFHEVAQLAGGGVWLLATADFRQYDDDAVEPVFRALAPVLPTGTPVRRDLPPERGWPPYRIVYRDAAEVR